jgi:hypothetical protein
MISNYMFSKPIELPRRSLHSVLNAGHEIDT